MRKLTRITRLRSMKSLQNWTRTEFLLRDVLFMTISVHCKISNRYCYAKVRLVRIFRFQAFWNIWTENSHWQHTVLQIYYQKEKWIYHKRLKQLASKPQARSFSGQIYIYDRIKSMNESILYNVDTLHNAIAANRRITFRYFDYNIKEKKFFVRTANCILLILSHWPLTMKIIIWYLIITSMRAMFITVWIRWLIFISALKKKHSQRTIQCRSICKADVFMFDGEIEQITALFHISYLNIILDRFWWQCDFTWDGRCRMLSGNF